MATIADKSRWDGKQGYVRLLAFVLVAYAWALFRALNEEWAKPDANYGPLVFVLALFLLYLKWDDRLRPKEVAATRLASALVVLLVAAALYLAGLVGDMVQFSLGSLVLLLLALCLILQKPSRHVLWPVLLLAFSVPLPGFLVDPVTLPLKLLAADGTVLALQALGYPVAQSGVVLQVGQYQLEVADACAGLRTLFSLEAIGLMYISLTPFPSTARNVLLALLVFPISLIANVSRVLILCLITVHFGDSAGQGFLHGFTGMTLFAIAVVLLIAVDRVIRAFCRPPPAVGGVPVA